jgi:hypothetical protein
MKIRLTPKSFVLLAGTAVCVFLLATCIHRNPLPPYEFKTLDCGNGKTIVIRLGQSLDRWGCYPVYYEVKVGDQTAIPERQVTGVWPGTDFGFELISAENGKLVGVLLRPLVHNLDRSPHFEAGGSWTREVISASLIIVHDFPAGKSFASIRAGNDPAARTLVDRLLNAHPEWINDAANSDLLKDVVCLSLDDGKGDTVSDWSGAHLLPGLQMVASHSPLSSRDVESLSRIASLKALVLSDARIEDDDVRRLSGLHNLETIILPLTGPSSTAVGTLRKALPQTQVMQRDGD